MTGRTARRVFFALLLAMTMGGWVPTSRCSFAGQESSSALEALKLGLGAMEEGDYESALGHYGRALESAGVDEIRFQAHLGMGSAYAASDRLDDAVAAYRAALEIKPNHAATLYSLGLVTKDQGRYEEAARLFANAAVRDPQLGEALVELGIVYEHLGRHEDALEACRRATTVLEDDEPATLCIAVAFFQMGLYAEGIQAFETALEINPGNPRAHYGLGLAKLYNEDRDGAIAEVGVLNQLDPALANELYERIFPP
jgi:tetratricopeptide (TPR) repeat protein